MFTPVDPKQDFIALEHDTLEFWRREGIAEKRRARNASGPIWSFLDGPITANNPMGVHHAWGRTLKDAYQRYHAMRGRRLRHQNGFDCQGLWVEVEVERELGLSSKRDIEAFGLERFVRLCKQRVLRFAAVQTEQSVRLGYWMTWDDPALLRQLAEAITGTETVTVPSPNGPVTGSAEEIAGRLGTAAWGPGSYFTFSTINNYAIWHFLKRCHDHGWIYRGEDVMPWCPRCGTGISQMEMSEGYEETTHTALYVRFPLCDEEASLLVWTTTPWTLPANVGAAVHPAETYLRVRVGNEVLYLLGARRETLGAGSEVLGTVPGRDLVGRRYRGPFDDLPAQDPDQHRVIAWEGVSSTEGTGIVHIAPGCGKEDFELGRAEGLRPIVPLSEHGIFESGFGALTGRHASDVADEVTDTLRQAGALYRAESYTHRYPHCWRCKTELVYRLVPEWFISMGAPDDRPPSALTPQEKAASLRHQIMDVVGQIRWIPEFGESQELDWLHNMGDWMISKKRFWGLALPIWVCEKCRAFDVIGGQEELRERAVAGWEEFAGHAPHRPHVDAVVIACRECGGRATRVPDVGNPWLDAGIVPFSTLGYFEDRAEWERWFPADFVTECFPGQFRNWFYALLAMSTVLDGGPPFRTLLGHAIVTDEQGEDMHKSKGNAIDFDEAAERMGADVMRWQFVRQNPAANLRFGYGAAQDIRRRFLTLWHTYAFFVTYARLDAVTPGAPASPPAARALLDRWILSRLQSLVRDVTDDFETYNAHRTPARIERFMDDLSNWYVRRSRRRFWKSSADADKAAAYATLHHCLVSLCQCLAPIAPFLAEAIYRNLLAPGPTVPESVHLSDFPTADATLIDPALERQIAVVREVIELGRAIRQRKNLRVRQPLSEIVIHPRAQTDGPAIVTLGDHVREELNVKQVRIVNDPGSLVTHTFTPNAQVLGPRLGARLRDLPAALATLDAPRAADLLEKGEQIEVVLGDVALRFGPDEVTVRTAERPGLAVTAQGRLVVGLATELTEELVSEGLARDLVRHVQDLRKEADFAVEDRIRLWVQAGERSRQALLACRDYVAEETLAVEVHEGAGGAHRREVRLGNERILIGVERVA